MRSELSQPWPAYFELSQSFVNQVSVEVSCHQKIFKNLFESFSLHLWGLKFLPISPWVDSYSMSQNGQLPIVLVLKVSSFSFFPIRLSFLLILHAFLQCIMWTGSRKSPSSEKSTSIHPKAGKGRRRREEKNLKILKLK